MQRKKRSTRSRPYKRKKKSTTLADGTTAEWVIQSQILKWLEASNILHWRQNSGTVIVGARRIKLGEPGLPDIVVIVPPTGRLLALECKSAKGKLRPDQVIFKAKAEANGATYKVVRTLIQAMNAVAEAMGKEQWKLLQQSAFRDEQSPWD